MLTQNPKFLVIGHVWPESKATAAGKRMMQLLHFFIEEGAEVIFCSTASKTRYSEDLVTLGIQEVFIELNNPSFDAFIRDLNPDIVIFDRFMTEEQFGWRVAENTPDAIRILNTEDLHSLRKSREKNCRPETINEMAEWAGSDLAMRELASILRSDLSLIISKHEYYLLVDRVKIPESVLLYLPFFEDETVLAQNLSSPDFESRSDFIFVGNGKHAPNVDAVHWLHTEIWPEIRQVLPSAKIRLYGAYWSDAILRLHRPELGFLVEGWIEDSKQAVNSSKVNLAPLRFGAGMKGKLVEAMASGTPSVSTAIGWEGFNVMGDFELSIAETASDFAQKSIELYSDKSSWELERDKQTRIYRTLFCLTEHKTNLRNSIMGISKNLKLHRDQNIIGNVLRHQSLASTKYMARWIEAKNQLN